MNPILTLASIVLPDDSGFARARPNRASGDSEPAEIWTHYDRRTFLYDAVHFRSNGILRLYLPRLLNLTSLFMESTFQVDGRAVRPVRHKVNRRFETVDIRLGACSPETLTIATRSGLAFHVPISEAAPDIFFSRRVIYTLMKDEKLEWIEDWLRFHREFHGADAVLIADNGSTKYSPEQLLRVIESVPGYVTARVLSVPLPWGPRGQARGVDDGKYLQTALLNLTRDRFFSSAYAVLNVDVDELVLPRGRHSVFDRAQRWGLVTFPGEWRYPSEGVEAVRHRHHLFRDPRQKPCATKYCYRPSSVLGRMCLSVHGLERLNRKFFSGRRDFLFLHCRNISTSWKYDRKKEANGMMVVDPEAAQAFDRLHTASPQKGLT